MATNVTPGKPRVGGAIFYAPTGTTLPTDASTDLDSAFISVGNISEDGVSNGMSKDTEKIYAWGGKVVLIVTKSVDDEFSFSMLDTKDANAKAIIFGSSNVETDSTTGMITSKVSADDPDTFSWVIDMILTDDTLKRIVVPQAQVSEIGDIEYQDGDVTKYEVTLSCLEDDDGYTHYEYEVPSEG